MKRVLLAFAVVIAVRAVFSVYSCNNGGESTDPGSVSETPAPPAIGFAVKNIYPHDTSSFTEGLLVHEGQLYESTGSPDGTNYASWMGPVDLKTGKPDRKIVLDSTYFGEGITIFNGKIYQLTYQEHKGFVYDARTFKKLQEFTYPGEGWSLTHDSAYLIMSDGSSNLQYLDPNTLKVVKITSVADNNGPVGNINELEYINGFIYANKWQTNLILKIDPASGAVVGTIDISSLEREAKSKFPNAQETNGIAYDAAANKMYVTGKCWPNLYEIAIN